MTEHPNVGRIKDGYAALANGDFAALNNLLAEDVVWHFGGRNQLSGDYRGRDAVYGFLGRLMEMTEGTVRMDVHAVLADDEHAVALIIGAASGWQIGVDGCLAAHVQREVGEFLGVVGVGEHAPDVSGVQEPQAELHPLAVLRWLARDLEADSQEQVQPPVDTLRGWWLMTVQPLFPTRRVKAKQVRQTVCLNFGLHGS